MVAALPREPNFDVVVAVVAVIAVVAVAVDDDDDVENELLQATSLA